MDEVAVVVAHQERATLRVGDVFLKVDADQSRLDIELRAMRLVPVPTAEILWHKPNVVALAALTGEALGRLQEPSTAPPESWQAVGDVIRRLHESPLPPWPGRGIDDEAEQLERACDWLVARGVVSDSVVRRNRELATTALETTQLVFAHGDLQIAHVFVSGDEVTGILDWSEAGPGDPMFDLASLTLRHGDHLDDLAAGYGELDLDAIRGWWSFRSLRVIPWLIEHEFDPWPEIAVLEG